MTLDHAALPKDLTTRLVRNRDTVHARDCSRIESKLVLPWFWAEGLEDSAIALAAANGLKFCQICKPIGFAS